MKEQQKETETLINAVEFFSSLLVEIDIVDFANLIDKLGKLVSDARDQIKSFEEVAYDYLEKYYKKKKIDKLITNIEKGKIVLKNNKDDLKKALETRGKILSTVGKFSLFCVDLKKKKEEAKK